MKFEVTLDLGSSNCRKPIVPKSIAKSMNGMAETGTDGRLHCKVALDISAEEMQVCQERGISIASPTKLQMVSSAISDAFVKTSKDVNKAIREIRIENARSCIDEKLVQLEGNIKYAIAKIVGMTEIASASVKALKERRSSLSELDDDDREEYDSIMKDAKRDLD